MTVGGRQVERLGSQQTSDVAGNDLPGDILTQIITLHGRHDGA